VWLGIFYGVSKGIDNTHFAFYSLQHYDYVHICLRKDYGEQKAVVVVQASLPGLHINPKHATMRKYLRGLGNLCSNAAHNQGRLTTK